MAIRLTADDAKQSLTAHVAAKGEEICAKYGPGLGWKDLQQLLQDRAFVRYPCEVVFDSAPLYPGEMAHPVAKGERPEEGFALHVHPLFLLQLHQVPHVVLYQLVAVNYGEFASSDDAEVFGAAALGLSPDDYYASLCALAGQLTGGDGDVEPAPAHEHPGGCGGGCSCGHG